MIAIPVFVEGYVLENSVTAQRQQSILLQLIMIRIGLHGREREVNDLLQHRGMNLRGEFSLREIVKTRSGCHLHAEFLWVSPHSGYDKFDYVDSGFVEVRR